MVSVYLMSLSLFFFCSILALRFIEEHLKKALFCFDTFGVKNEIFSDGARASVLTFSKFEMSFRSCTYPPTGNKFKTFHYKCEI